jgi:hypothetical protein
MTHRFALRSTGHLVLALQGRSWMMPTTSPPSSTPNTADTMAFA